MQGPRLLSGAALHLNWRAVFGRRSYGEGAHSLEHASVAVWGANTGVGKTLIAAALMRACSRAQDPVSPHLAVERHGAPVPDADLVRAITDQLAKLHPKLVTAGKMSGLAIVETAGGVCSPAPSGTMQVDALRPVRLPAILVADGRLGGISATLSAYESLLARGYDVLAVVGMDAEPLGNYSAIGRVIERCPSPCGATPRVLSLPLCEAPPEGDDIVPGTDAPLARWLQSTDESMAELLSAVDAAHKARTARLSAASGAAQDTIWWPFTQHDALRPGDVTVIDARSGEDYITATRLEAPAARGTCGAPSEAAMALQPLYDGCASWWTQGVPGHLQSSLASHATYAAGRYTHVIFPESVHEPALHLSQMVLASVGKGWASRVFFSDNGSTAVEVALKMAFKLYSSKRGFDLQSDEGRRLHILGFTNGYHGDTLGVMDCCPESVFNAGQMPWYQPRGAFVDPPTCGLVQGAWQVQPSGACPSTSRPTFDTLADVFADERYTSELAEHYEARIRATIEDHETSTGCRIAACLIEPIMQGAGGMVFIDPLFQKVTVKVCKGLAIPVIADEVFTGFWRLGHESAMGALGLAPDIACYAKLLTGGCVPLALTVASAAVFDCFRGDGKAQALLHGHSYTAHPVGCQVAVGALQMLGSAKFNPNIEATGRMTPCWPEHRVMDLSHHAAVEKVVALGTVLAVTLRVPAGSGGYASTVARDACRSLRQHGVYARPLGNVVYLMCTPMSTYETTMPLMDALERCLGGPATRHQA